MIPKLEPQFAMLLETEGFITAFWEISGDYRTQEDAYDVIEQRYISVFGKRRYSDFNSFRVTMYRHLKKKKSG